MDRDEPPTVPLTTLKVRAAFAGDEQAREWIVLRFSPLLLVQARYRMRSRLRRYYPPEEVVADTWLRALPQLGDFRQDGSRNTPRLVRFLATIVMFRVNELLRQWARSPLGGKHTSVSSSGEGTSLAAIAADPATGPLKSLCVRDEVKQVLDRIESLTPLDQEILVLRKVEGLSSSAVAKRLDTTTNAVDTRLSRCLARLRSHLRDSVFEELDEDDAESERGSWADAQ